MDMIMIIASCLVFVSGSLPWTPCSYSMVHDRGVPATFNIEPASTNMYYAQEACDNQGAACGGWSVIGTKIYVLLASNGFNPLLYKQNRGQGLSQKTVYRRKYDRRASWLSALREALWAMEGSFATNCVATSSNNFYRHSNFCFCSRLQFGNFLVICCGTARITTV